VLLFAQTLRLLEAGQTPRTRRVVLDMFAVMIARAVAKLDAEERPS
jgi:hypothetical protein